MAISAALVKELRERTGAGMMECKKALVETNGDIDAAVEQLRKSGQAKADKKAGRTAAEGRIVVATSGDGKQAAIVEVNCETDFVAGDDNFIQFADAVAQRVLADRPADVEALSAMALKDGDAATVEEARKALVAKIGENMTVRRFQVIETGGVLGVYLHGTRIGVVVDLQGDDEDLARDLAMHVAASRPVCVSEADVPADTIAKEREIFAAQAAESGKPEDIVAKMVDGRIKKFLKEITLLGQPFVKDPDTTVEKLLAKGGAQVNGFVRFEVGEGIEKKSENFADEVMAQVRGG
ncbi:MAG TPA: translation elongation factor Ts [Gammaproteobacteria bacterium]|nr:translation elongation factor Ts [Gammaproteobacteria bacterium]